ncbi:AAA family ATPase [Scytonema sp. PRP1]|uniref:AAA family ATPase n=1 Tax=Scytonema sp. PRP1 TaxID=3120513 RepID=UPI002FD1A0AC
MSGWYLFDGKDQRKEVLTKEKTKELREKIKKIDAPPWRQFGKEQDLTEEADNKRFESLIKLAKNKEREIKKGKNFRLSDSPPATEVRDAVNAAIYLRRPLLITGNPGSGKTSLAYAIAYELNLGPVLSWSITARSTLQEGLYRYDAIARLQDANKNNSDEQPIGQYIKLGALGTAFLPSYLPRVLLIDEIDKSDINLPNDLLNLFEEGQFEIPELVRRSKKKISQETDNLETDNLETDNLETENLFEVQTQDEGIDVVIKGGRVRCYAFPIIVMTSNGERDFPQAFKRRCLRVRMPDPTKDELEAIIKAHFGEKLFNDKAQEINDLMEKFIPKEGEGMDKATDQLLNAIHIFTQKDSPRKPEEKEAIRKLLMKPLTESE